jgi:hypothetical protein
MCATDVVRYARAHHALAILTGTAVVALASALLGGFPVALPSIGSGGVTTGIPFRREMPLLSAVFLTAALGGPMAAHDEAGAVRMHRCRTLYCTALTLTACAFSFGAEATAVGPESGVVFVRSLLVWFGLALVSVKLLGRQLGWAVPLGAAFLVIWYPETWWDWTAAPGTDVFSWGLAATAQLAGIGAIAATDWRRKVAVGRLRPPAPTAASR